MRSKGKFIDEQELLNQWQLWVDSANRVEDRVIPDRLVVLLYALADHLLEHPRFVRYSTHMKEDMRQEAVIKALKNLKNFKKDKGKMFSYMTTCCWTAYVVYLANYYKELNKKRELILDALNNIDEKQLGSINYLKELLGDLQETVEEYKEKDDKDA